MYWKLRGSIYQHLTIVASALRADASQAISLRHGNCKLTGPTTIQHAQAGGGRRAPGASPPGADVAGQKPPSIGAAPASSSRLSISWRDQSGRPLEEPGRGAACDTTRWNTRRWARRRT